MKKLMLIISIIAIAIILVGAYYVLDSFLFKKNFCCAVPCSDEYYEALDNSDVTICELVTNLSSKEDYCRDNCIKEIAYNEGNPELCELINSDANYNLAEYGSPEVLVPIKDFCYIHLAGKLGEGSLCDNVKSNWAKTNCPLLAQNWRA